jgi:hypothetical protein
MEFMLRLVGVEASILIREDMTTFQETIALGLKDQLLREIWLDVITISPLIIISTELLKTRTLFNGG